MTLFHGNLPENLPGHYGEYLVAQKLKEISFPELEAWFNIDHLPGTPELDLILFDPKNGLYLIEIKSFKIDQIVSSRSDGVTTTDEKRPVINPIQQIRRNQISLMNYFKVLSNNSKENVPFIQTSILWSMIRKEVWLEKFPDAYNQDLSHKMIFSDDLTSSASLSWRLDHLRKHPLLGVHPSFEKNYENKITFVRNVLKSNPYSNISKSKISEIKAPSLKSQEKANEFKFGAKSYVKIFRGPPGTGKTTILREIGLNHARDGAAVLYLCFNKVLAAEQRREFQILGEKNENKGFVHSHDIYQFFQLYNKGIYADLDWSTKIDMLLESENFRQLEYDTILIDESQDLEYAVFEMLKHITKKNYSLFISYGKGQELYNQDQEVSPAPFLKELMQNNENVITLNRPFRSSRAPFFVAQSFYTHAPDFEKGVDFLKKFSDAKQCVEPELALEFSIPPTPDEIEIQYYLNEEMRYSVVKEKIKYILKKINNNYEDFMILVGPESSSNIKNGSSYSDILKILHELEAPYTDYVPNEKRREISTNVKICTLNNSRGLSANFVLILDFEECQNWVEKRKKGRADFRATTKNLGYITLSRAKKSSIILLDFTKINDSCNFLIKTDAWIKDKLN